MADDSRVQEQESEEGGSRRSFLGATALIGAVIGAMVAFPVTRLFAAPLTSPRKRGWHPLGPAEEFTNLGDQLKEAKLSYDRADGWYTAHREERVAVRETGPDSWTVLSTKCTHFGCGVTWQPDKQIFFCPCHNGEFHPDGRVKAGPPERPLEKYNARKNPKTGALEIQEI